VPPRRQQTSRLPVPDVSFECVYHPLYKCDFKQIVHAHEGGTLGEQSHLLKYRNPTIVDSASGVIRMGRNQTVSQYTPVPLVSAHMKCSLCGSRKIDTKPQLYPGGVAAMCKGRMS
jgi:hypothetical protein